VLIDSSCSKAVALIDPPLGIILRTSRSKYSAYKISLIIFIPYILMSSTGQEAVFPLETQPREMEKRVASGGYTKWEEHPLGQSLVLPGPFYPNPSYGVE
jgi:hypothetical protein